MKFSVKYDKTEYYKDSKRLLTYEVICDKPFLIFVFVYIIIVTTHFINILFDFDIYVREIALLTYSLGIGLLGMIVHSIFSFFNKLNKIKTSFSYLPKNEEYIKIDGNSIELSWNNEILNYKWESFKKVIFIGNTIFLIPLNKSPLIRLNSTEIKDFDFDETLMFLKEKFGKIVFYGKTK